MRSSNKNFKRITKLVKTFESDVEAMADDEYDESDIDLKRRMMSTKRRPVADHHYQAYPRHHHQFQSPMMQPPMQDPYYEERA